MEVYEVLKRPDGDFDVVAVVRQRFGTFPRQSWAQTVCDLMNGKDPVVMPPRAPVNSEPATDRKLTAEEKAIAFAALEAGEKLADVAARMGVTLSYLRACWAKRPRNALVTTPPAPPNSDALVECRMCQKPFNPGQSGRDTCARCSREG